MSLPRRTLLGAPLLALAWPAAASVPPGGGLRFEIFRNDSSIGTHALRFDTQGDRLDVHIDVEMRVGLGPITFFRYRHQGVERWRGGQLVRIDTETDNNGQPLRVAAERLGDAVRITATDRPETTLPATALPLTHWNRRQMSVPLFNPQDGKPMQLTATPRGVEPVRLADGSEVDASRYTLTGEARLDDWYDAQDVWTALRATVEDGSVLDYRRLA